jgi:hypothetical protein
MRWLLALIVQFAFFAAAQGTAHFPSLRPFGDPLDGPSWRGTLRYTDRQQTNFAGGKSWAQAQVGRFRG